MNQAESLISFYQSGFKICLVLSALFLILTVVLFFRFDIRRIIANRTGRAQRRTIEQMKEANERTGRLHHAQKVARGEYTPVSLGDGKTMEQSATGNSAGPSGGGETTPLSVSPVAEMVGQSVNSGVSHKERKKVSYAGKFVITNEVLFIHTDERI